MGYVCSFPFAAGICCCAYDKEGSEYSDVSLHFFNLNQTAWRWQWNLWSSIHLDFRFCYQISASQEQGRYFMFKAVFIFTNHISLSNCKMFLQLYVEQFFHIYEYQLCLVYKYIYLVRSLWFMLETAYAINNIFAVSNVKP